MKVLKDSNIMFLRVPDFKNYNSIEEHQKVLNKEGNVWMVKLGKIPNEKFIEKMKKEGGYLILKTTPKNGNKLYLCEIEEFNYSEDVNYPSYYDELFYDLCYTIKDVKKMFWVNIKSFNEINEEELYNFEITSTGKKLHDAVFNSRAPQIYAKAINDLEI